MEETVYYSNLYDIYSELLTEKQKQVFRDYYFENLTTNEIAENENVSKNAVSKQLIAVKQILENYEKVLNFLSKRNKLYKEFSKNEETLNKIKKILE